MEPVSGIAWNCDVPFLPGGLRGIFSSPRDKSPIPNATPCTGLVGTFFMRVTLVRTISFNNAVVIGA